MVSQSSNNNNSNSNSKSNSNSNSNSGSVNDVNDPKQKLTPLETEQTTAAGATAGESGSAAVEGIGAGTFGNKGKQQQQKQKQQHQQQQQQQHREPKQTQALYLRYPVNTCWEFTVHENEVISGTVYCTDEISQTVALQNPLHHTTLSVEIRLIQVASIRKERKLDSINNNNANSIEFMPLPVVQKKTLEERERKAIRSAEESLRHINQNASSKGQEVFDRLLKACNEVVWKGESIIVLNQIQVDPPYGQEQCKILKTSMSTSSPAASSSATGTTNTRNNTPATLQDGSLDRVKKIVAACTASS